MALQASSGFNINSAFWLRSLSASEQGPTRRVLEDLAPYFQQIGLTFHLQDLRTASDLYRALDMLAKPGVLPIVQLDMHGTKEGLLLAGSGEIASWDQVVPRFRAINVASGGNLCVIAGVCFALYALKEAPIYEASPVNILIAPDREVQTGKLESGLFGFYKGLFSGGEISVAFTEHLGEPLKLYNAERFFIIAVCKYILNWCKGKGAAKRRESLLTEVLLTGQLKTPDNLRRIRKMIRDGIRPDQQMLDQYAQRFLLGRRCPFSIDQLLDEVEKAQRMGGAIG